MARDGGYLLTSEAIDVDVDRFERLVREAAEPACPGERAVDALSQALALWRGRALEGFAAEEWARGEAVRLEELRANAADDRAEALLALGHRPKPSPTSRRRPRRRRCASALTRC